MSVLSVQYSPRIQSAARWVLADLIAENDSRSFSRMTLLKFENLAIASRVKISTS
jgi:hypothetical protein